MGDLINGIFLGGVYTTVALGLTLVFGVMRLVNLAHGELLVGGGFLAYSVTSLLGVDPLIALLLVVPAVMAICTRADFEMTTSRPLTRIEP